MYTVKSILIPEVPARYSVTGRVHVTSGVIDKNIETQPQIQNNAGGDCAVRSVDREQGLSVDFVVVQGLNLRTSPVRQGESVDTARNRVDGSVNRSATEGLRRRLLQHINRVIALDLVLNHIGNHKADVLNGGFLVEVHVPDQLGRIGRFNAQCGADLVNHHSAALGSDGGIVAGNQGSRETPRISRTLNTEESSSRGVQVKRLKSVKGGVGNTSRAVNDKQVTASRSGGNRGRGIGGQRIRQSIHCADNEATASGRSQVREHLNDLLIVELVRVVDGDNLPGYAHNRI